MFFLFLDEKKQNQILSTNYLTFTIPDSDQESRILEKSIGKDSEKLEEKKEDRFN